MRTSSGASSSTDASLPFSSRTSANRLPFAGISDSKVRTEALIIARLPVSGCSTTWKVNARRPRCLRPAGSASLTVPETTAPAGTSSRPSRVVKGRSSRPSMPSAARFAFDDRRVCSWIGRVVPAATWCSVNRGRGGLPRAVDEDGREVETLCGSARTRSAAPAANESVANTRATWLERSTPSRLQPLFRAALSGGDAGNWPLRIRAR